MDVKILSGLPGCGKSRLAKCLKCGKGNKVILSADDFHLVDGVYVFNRSQAQEAHDWCLRNYLNALNDLCNGLVVVDNTNTTIEEIAVYYRIALALGHKVEVIRIWCEPALSMRRNEHKVPNSNILSMYQNLISGKLPPYWNVSVILAGE